MTGTPGYWFSAYVQYRYKMGSNTTNFPCSNIKCLLKNPPWIKGSFSLYFHLVSDLSGNINYCVTINVKPNYNFYDVDIDLRATGMRPLTCF